MTVKECDWITLHRVRFEVPFDGTGAPLSGPERAKAWRFYPSSPQNESGMRSNVSDIWGGFGLYDSRDAAEADLADMGNLAWIERTVERWHALAVPINHHGTTNWSGELSDSTLSCAASDPRGRLVVLTSAGYTDPGPEDVPRISDFLTNVDRVTQFYRSLPGNLAADVFSGAGVDGHDGATMSIWVDDAAMRAAAYKSGLHKEQMDRHNLSAMFDRSSWTRARIVASEGYWDGQNPAL